MDTDTAVKHTPGPWERNGGSIIDARGNVIAQRFSRRHIERGETWADCIEPVEADANARLIASAPTLLAALRQAVTVLEAYHERCDWSSDACADGSIDLDNGHAAITDALAAIQQAEGA